MENTSAADVRQSMKITLDEDRTHFGVYAYRPGEITIIAPNDGGDMDNDGTFGNKMFKKETLTQSLIIMPHCLISDWPPRTITDLTAEHFDVLLPKPPQILLLGTGVSHSWPTPQVLAVLTNRGVAVEVMDSAAACRTYAILASDGRDVGAALLVQ